MKDKIIKSLFVWYKTCNGLKHFFAHWLLYFYYMPLRINIGNIKMARDRIVKDNPSKSSKKIFWDLLTMNILKGASPEEFITYHLQDITLRQRLTFMFCIELNLFSGSCNLNAPKDILDDKSNTSHYFKNFYKRDCLLVQSRDNYKDFCDFCHNHSRFFYKPFKGACGKDSGVADTSIKSKDELFDYFVSNGPYNIEELIIQCDEMASFNSSSVNTVRTTMFRTKDGIELLFGFIRCGRKGFTVDNGGAGGIIIPYDPDSGKLGKYGFDESGRKYTEHPDSNVVFEGFQIPRWNEILDVSNKVTEMLPDFSYVGWDIAVTNDGVQLVEGNSRPMFVGLQGMHTTGFRKEINDILKTGVISSSFREKQKEILS